MAMNRRQKEVQRAALKREKQIIAQLKKTYEKARQDCADRIAALNARRDMQNLRSIIYQREYQEALLKQINEVLEHLNKDSYRSLEAYLHDCYETGAVGTAYDLHGQRIPVIIPIRQDEVAKALTNDYSNIAKTQRGKAIYERMGENTDTLRTAVRQEVSRGIANGSSWLDMAEKVTKSMNSPFAAAFSRALLITRTEGHRVQNQAQLDVQQHAKEAGADIVKQWDATLDGNTRPWHADADGQIRELEQKFSVGGEEMDAPGIGGSARNVCNCRCVLLQRAKWALDEDELKTLQNRAEYFGLDKTENFEDFKEKYLKSSAIIFGNQMYRSTQTDDKITEMVVGRANPKIIKVRKLSEYENVFVSDQVHIKPKAMHQINLNTLDAAVKWGISKESLPNIVVASFDELQCYGKYDPISNTVLYIPQVTQDNGYTEYHEMWHAKQAQSFKKKITNANYAEYMKWLNRTAKKKIDKLGVTEYNVDEISDYAKKCYSYGRFDEVEAEYMTKRRR